MMNFLIKSIFKKILNILNKNKNPCVYGNLIVYKGNTIFRKWISGSFKFEKIINGWHPPHPGFSFKKNIQK